MQKGRITSVSTRPFFAGLTSRQRGVVCFVKATVASTWRNLDRTALPIC